MADSTPWRPWFGSSADRAAALVLAVAEQRVADAAACVRELWERFARPSAVLDAAELPLLDRLVVAVQQWMQRDAEETVSRCARRSCLEAYQGDGTPGLTVKRLNMTVGDNVVIHRSGRQQNEVYVERRYTRFAPARPGAPPEVRVEI